MKCCTVLLSFLLLALAAAGCEPGTELERPRDAEALRAAGFDFEGDFSGPLGLQLWSVRNEMQQDVPGTLAKVHDMGFREVELAGTYGMSAEAFRQELDRAGLEATAMHVPYERLRDDLDAVLAEADTLGVDYVGVAWIPHPEGQPFTEAMAREAAADFNRWGAAAREAGLQFFYHIHGYEFRPTPTGTLPFDVLVEETDPEDVKFEMDVLWAARPGQDPAALLRKYPDRWALMHVKDLAQGASTNDFTGHATPEEEAPVGQGQIDFPAVFEAAEEIGIERYYIEDESRAPLENIPKSTDYVRTVAYGAANP